MIRQTIVFALVLLSVLAAAEQPPSSAVKAEMAAQQPAIEEHLRVEDAVRFALEHNPSVKSAAYVVDAQRHKVPQAKSLPDPTVSVGWMGNSRPFSVMEGDPSSYRSVSAMQMLPFPGKLRLKGEMASKEVEVAQADYEGVRRRIASEVKAAYYEYFYFDKALETTRRNKDLLVKLSKISEARYRVGKAMQPDVLKSQTEISMLLQRLTMLEQQRETAQARLNMLMGREPESPLPPAADVAPLEVALDLEQLYQLAQRTDPMLARETRMLERNQIAVAMAKKEYRPDLSIGYMYQQRPMMMDMKGFTFTVNVPIFYKSKQREAVRQAQQEVMAAQQSRDSRINELRFEVKQQYLAAKAAKSLLDLYSKAVVPQSSLALESSMSAYQVGSSDFLTMLSNFSTLLNYETEYYRQVADYQIALANIETLIGVDLTNVVIAGEAVKQ